MPPVLLYFLPMPHLRTFIYTFTKNSALFHSSSIFPLLITLLTPTGKQRNNSHKIEHILLQKTTNSATIFII